MSDPITTSITATVNNTHGIRENNPIMEHFKFSHLPDHLQAVSAPICELAEAMFIDLPDGPEKSAGLRKLLEAKDCFVRAAIA